MLTKCLGREKLELFFRVALKAFADPWSSDRSQLGCQCNGFYFLLFERPDILLFSCIKPR